MTERRAAGPPRRVAPAARRARSDTSRHGALSDALAPAKAPDGEALNASDGVTTPDSSVGGRRRPRVRRSKALKETIATNPSPALDPSTPASTGDTSRPSATAARHQPSVRELVIGVLSERDRETLLKGGTPRHEASSSSGPLRTQVLLKLREILVRQYTPAAWR